MSSFLREYGYPYCLGRFKRVELNRDPKWIKPCDESLLPINVAMPHEFYLVFMKMVNGRLKDWWRRQLLRGTFSSIPSDRHNCEDVPSYVRICLSWIVGYDARLWSPAGIRWSLWDVYGSLGIECMKRLREAVKVSSAPDRSRSTQLVRVPAHVEAYRLLTRAVPRANGFVISLRETGFGSLF